MPTTDALRLLTKRNATKKVILLLATGEKIQPHNANLQLDPKHQNVPLVHTGILTDVSINANKLDTASGISKQRMDHYQKIRSTHAM
jgi:uncharacterized protein YdbL (DUF1318 family)